MPVNSFDDYYMSWRPKIERGKKALYLMIAEQLENDIKQGVILPGTKLPPQRELADFLDVNVSTVSKAFKQCELKGLLTSTIGSGTFVSYDATTNSYIMPGKKDLEMIEMASIFPDMGANEEIVEKLKEISMEPDVGNLFTYAKPGGEIDLCGHATLACAYVVMNKIEPDLKTVTFSTMSGDLIVNRKDDLYEMDFPAYDLKPVEITDAMVDAIGAKPVEAYMGRDLLCVFDDEKTVRELNPNLDKVKTIDGLLLHATALGKDTDSVSRSFAPKLNVPEDPVCGSGHCHIAPYWMNKLNKNSIVAYQASPRGGTLYCTKYGDRVRLSGKAALYSEADINIG